MNFGLILVLCLIGLWSDLIMIQLKKRNTKKCNYNCENCKNWDCFSKYCNKKRDEN